MKSEICIIRHGITTGNVQHLYYGSTDVPLAERGVLELKELTGKGIYPDREIADFFTTGMLRTEQTLKLIYGDRDHMQIPQLKELDFGQLEMKHYTEVESVPEYRRWMNAEEGVAPPPGGEHVPDFVSRVLEGFEKLKNYTAMKNFRYRHHKDIIPLSVCICHGGTISVIMDSLFPGEKDNMFEWIPDPGHGYLLKLEDLKVKGVEKF